MRPLRLLLSFATTLIALTLLLYMAFSSPHHPQTKQTSPDTQRTKASAFFSFASPASLFPPSAIISLTDDNSTFFLARPAAFGPPLPTAGLSGALWIGSGFGDEAMGRGELGCSDVPGWDDGSGNMGALGLKTPPKAPSQATSENNRATSQAKHSSDTRSTRNDDGTDDHLNSPSPATTPSKASNGNSAGHADIESLQESAEIKGKVVLLKRGGCGFLEKARWAQRRGGVALIVGDDVRGGVLVRMYARGDTSDIIIPALFTSHTTAHLLSSLLPTGGMIQDLSPEDLAKLNMAKGGKSGKSKNQQVAAKQQNKAAQATKSGLDIHEQEEQRSAASSQGWLRSFLKNLGLTSSDPGSNHANQRPPSSGRLDWIQVENGRVDQNPVVLEPPTPATGDAVVEEHDWYDGALTTSPTSVNPVPRKTYAPGRPTNGRNNLPSSGEYPRDVTTKSDGWLRSLLDGKRDSRDTGSENPEDIGVGPEKDHAADPSGPHEGLWVTLTPTNMSTSPFFDTLLVLVVSPLVTLTIVYALLLLRSRIRRRRWRAPKSIVERLPVRTYHTISDTSPAATPTASSPTTPLLQHLPPQSATPSRPRSAPESDVPATSSSFLQPHSTSEEERRESGLAAWRRRYGGRQKECVVCLEEYEDGVSQVMSLPCGHEFHADCITPWLVTRRRTCPICKGDVVRSLSQSYHDRAISAFEARFRDEDDEDVQAQAAEAHNDSPSASRPVPISPSSNDADIEANWPEQQSERHGRAIPQSRNSDLSSSLREVSSSVATTIWRGFEAAVGRAGSLHRRSSREDVVDRDR